MVVMTRRFDPELLARLSEEKHRLIRTGSFGQSYTAVIDALRSAQDSDDTRRDNLSSSPKHDDYSNDPRQVNYKELE